MTAARPLLRSCTWLVWLAVLALVCVPTLSRLIAQDAPAWGEVCSSSGTALASAAGLTDERSDLPAAHALQHCPLCGLAADAPLLPTLQARHLGFAPARRPLATATVPRAVESPMRPAAQPRAPPILFA